MFSVTGSEIATLEFPAEITRKSEVCWPCAKAWADTAKSRCVLFLANIRDLRLRRGTTIVDQRWPPHFIRDETCKGFTGDLENVSFPQARSAETIHPTYLEYGVRLNDHHVASRLQEQDVLLTIRENGRRECQDSPVAP